MSQFSPSDHSSTPTPDDQDALRALLRTTPTLAVPRDFTLDPAAFRAPPTHLTVQHPISRLIGRPIVLRGLGAAAAILMVIGLALLTQRPAPTAANTAMDVTRQTAIALLPSATGQNATAQKLGVPLSANNVLPATSIPMATIIAAKSANNAAAQLPQPAAGSVPGQPELSNQGNLPGSLAVSPGSASIANNSGSNSNTPQNGALAVPAPNLSDSSLSSGIQSPNMAQAPNPNLSSRSAISAAGAASGASAVTPNAQQRADFSIFVQSMLNWLRSLLRLR